MRRRRSRRRSCCRGIRGGEEHGVGGGLRLNRGSRNLRCRRIEGGSLIKRGGDLVGGESEKTAKREGTVVK